MGQSNSRLQEQSPLPAPEISSSISSPVTDVSADTQPDSPLPVGGDASNPQCRRSLRKNILKFVRPSSIRNRSNGGTTNSGDTGRSWRNHRRWSKANRNQGTHEDGSILSGPSSEGSGNGSTTTPPLSLEKGKQREATPIAEEDDNHIGATTHDSARLAYPISPLESELPSMSVLESLPSAADILSCPRLDNTTLEEIVTEFESDTSSHHSSSVPREGLSSSPSPLELPPQVSTQSQQQQQPGPLQRQFPPPGTLVVVQGIVHTTDVSRPNAPASSLPSNTGDTSVSQSESSTGISEQGVPRSRNRLSSLLRPRSSSRPVSAIISDPLSIAPNITSQNESTSVAGSESQVSTNESVHTAVNASPIAIANLASQDSPSIDNRTPLISSSSIDVLGTLLSVAAAATAASLLTGSSEPILSSGLAPPHPSIASRIPQSSVPNASLPNLPTYGPHQDSSGFPDVTAAGRSERMRQAWGAIRERLGLRPSTSPTDDLLRPNHNQDTNTLDSSPTLSQVDGVELGSPIDTRELMLAEMARAFNIGLGLNGLGGLAPGNATSGRRDHEDTNNSDETRASPEETSATYQSQAQSTENSNATLPPEGSFERFLIDLQNELRSALTRPDDESFSDDYQPLPPAEMSQAERHQERPSDVVDDPPFHSSPASADGMDHSGEPNGPPLRDEGDHASMPSLQDVTDSESEFEDEREDNDYEDDDFQSAEQRSLRDDVQQAPAHAQQPSTTSGTGRIDAAGRINWWRLYRFPPIVSPTPESWRQPLASQTTQTSTDLPTSPSYTLRPSPPLSSDTDLPVDPTGLVEPLTPTGTPLEAPPPTQTTSQNVRQLPPQTSVVVPVIVVGLQSVNSEWRPDLPQQPEEGMDFLGQPASERNPDDENDGDDDLDGWGGQHHATAGNEPDGTRGRGRPRGWHSRAADAIRNLRHGRRNGGSGLGSQLPIVTPGSRTFLIYVIGGYYPPDHNIVTGGPNILDSFEALLELADLLGQVKPPTVSKDEIEKSGLKIIKASDLPQHEKDGKVSSNCTDRCLICLDDYEPEDPIRVMSCRHAFHKGCVDEWLQRGRNNCPACRSTGVPTDGHPATSYSTTAS